MEKLKEKAHAKMLKEMEDAQSTVTERIHVYLCNIDDKELLEAICKEDRTLIQATDYLYAKGSNLAVKGVADVTPSMEHKWVEEYYLKEEIFNADLMRLPKEPPKEIEVEKIVEVEKVIYKEPTFEEIGKYLEQQAKEKNTPKKKQAQQEALSFDL